MKATVENVNVVIAINCGCGVPPFTSVEAAAQHAVNTGHKMLDGIVRIHPVGTTRHGAVTPPAPTRETVERRKFIEERYRKFLEKRVVKPLRAEQDDLRPPANGHNNKHRSATAGTGSSGNKGR